MPKPHIRLSCWPGRPHCTNPRTWAVFHEIAEAQKPFDEYRSIYVGCCDVHLTDALRHDPAALNVVKPLPRLVVEGATK